MDRLGGGFWEGGAVAVEKDVNDDSRGHDEQEEEDWRTEVEQALEALANIVVEEGCAYLSDAAG